MKAFEGSNGVNVRLRVGTPCPSACNSWLGSGAATDVASFGIVACDRGSPAEVDLAGCEADDTVPGTPAGKRPEVTVVFVIDANG